jgi:erythromycin esterase-like protein
MASDSILVRALIDTVTPLTNPTDLDSLVESLAPARFVLLGEASHGTHEFYRWRSEISQRLIRDHGFAGIAAEADWPDAYRVNRFVRGESDDANPEAALNDFQRFPQWMWRNKDILDLVEWLRDYNDHAVRKVGFYGLDLYSLHASIAAVVDYLEAKDPTAAAAARARYACFDTMSEEPQLYGLATARGVREDCEQEVIEQLLALQKQRHALAEKGTLVADQHFAAEQNARVIKNGEEYYREMYRGRASTWNLRDTHMMDTLDALSTHLGGDAGAAKLIVWAHNSHVGDAEATERDFRGEINIGHLCRQRHPKNTKLVGFTTHHGTVTAASDWGEPAERKRVRPALPRSYEAVFHETNIPAFLLHLDRRLGEAAGALYEARLHRAIGVVYRPDTERASHYYHSRLPAQFDAVIHVDETRALEPLERTAGWERGELPDTFPTGL